MDFYTGIDACKKGWIMIVLPSAGNEVISMHYLESFSHVKDFWMSDMRALADMPIGLLEKNSSHLIQRPCDAAARKLLGKRHSSIFSPPCMEAIYEQDYWKACEQNFAVIGRKLSKQSWNIAPRIREINAFLHLYPKYRSHILESSPELAFQILNQNQALLYNKKEKAGQSERIEIIKVYIPHFESYFLQQTQNTQFKSVASADDLLDAMALAILNKLKGVGLRNISDVYPKDSLGNGMGVWI